MSDPLVLPLRALVLHRVPGLRVLRRGLGHVIAHSEDVYVATVVRLHEAASRPVQESVDSRLVGKWAEDVGERVLHVTAVHADEIAAHVASTSSMNRSSSASSGRLPG